ncbi:hypothetical protein QOZ80_1AG0028970 [Eleusine coracana subsp. coracana]|nr:hypothetical protein QOZ80_1AG0028970 [Eleusine coracana subsp. coracana]
MSQEEAPPSPAMATPPPPATPHVLLVSLPLQGHVTPLLVLGRRLASRGLLVTFTTVPLPGSSPWPSTPRPSPAWPPATSRPRSTRPKSSSGAKCSSPTWVLVNTFDELERAAIDALRAHLPAVLPVGPLFRAEEDDEEDECATWLDARAPRSVVFVAFGSLVKPSREDMAELAEGLASTGRPFLWVVRHDTRDLLPDDHLRNEKNKMGKALAAGVPVATYPSWSDQPTNAKLLVDAYGVGVRLPVPPTRDALRRCVEEVMAGPGAEAMRARAGEWKAKATAAVAPSGSADRGVQDFVDAVRLI